MWSTEFAILPQGPMDQSGLTAIYSIRGPRVAWSMYSKLRKDTPDTGTFPQLARVCRGLRLPLSVSKPGRRSFRWLYLSYCVDHNATELIQVRLTPATGLMGFKGPSELGCHVATRRLFFHCQHHDLANSLATFLLGSLLRCFPQYVQIVATHYVASHTRIEGSGQGT